MTIATASQFGLVSNPYIHLLSGVPVIGGLVQSVAMQILLGEMNTTVLRETASKEIAGRRLLNEYQILGIFRELLNAALVIAAVAYKILELPYMGVAIVFTGLAIYQYRNVQRMNEEIELLERNFGSGVN